MARPKKTAAPAEKKPTTEQLDDEALQALAFQHKKKYEHLLAAKKKADADFKNGCKLAKAELGDDAIDIIKDLIALDSEEGEARIKATVERQLRVARWAGAELGTQFEMFEGEDRTPAVDRAYAAGKRAGMAGEPAKPPHAPSTPQYAKWMEGHGDGQEALARATFKAPAAETEEGAAEREDADAPPAKSFGERLRHGNPRGAFDVHDPAQIGTEPATFRQ